MNFRVLITLIWLCLILVIYATLYFAINYALRWRAADTDGSSYFATKKRRSSYLVNLIDSDDGLEELIGDVV